MSESELPRIVVLVSGEGTNLQALIDAARNGKTVARVQAVFSDRREARALERARAAGIAAQYIGRNDFTDRASYERALSQAIEEQRPDAIVLAGFMRVLHAELLGRFEGRILNLHPSLLPKYRGLDTHRRVLAAGDSRHGATVHFVTEELDAGPSVIQYRIGVHADDTPESLAERVHRGEHIVLPRAAGWLAEGRLRLIGKNVMLDAQRLDGPIVVEGDQ